MTIVKRLRLLTAVLAAAAASAAVGTTVFGDVRPAKPGDAAPVRPAGPPADEFARTKFTDTPAVAFQTAAGETVFAWQLRPALPASAARPRDILVMVDTSASQAGGPLARARSILAGLAAEAGRDDRLDVWTVNINQPSATRSLTNGFVPANAEAVQAAIAKLADVEYGSGAVDLKAGLEAALKGFEGRDSRQQVLLYLGDGESAASPTPLTEAGRVELGNLLLDKDVAFFAVPLGLTVNPHNLHGLATLTGGTVVRMTEDALNGKSRLDLSDQLKAAFDVPVLRPEKVTFEPAGVELYPTRLPPLRADRPTLVVGSLKAPAASLSATIEGRVGGKKTTVAVAEKVPAPAIEHYFVNSMLAQWRDAAAKDAPAILPADRAMAMAAEQFRMFRDEFTVQGVWAISADRLDHAQKLFEAAAKIDPAAPEAVAGLKVLARMRSGEVAADKVKHGLAAGQTLARLQQPPADPTPAAGSKQPVPPPAGAVPGPTPGERDLVGQARAAQQVLEQEFRVLVDDTIRRARRLLNTDPDTANEDLKRQRETVLANDQISDPVRRRLVTDLDAAIREVQLQGAEIKRQLAAQRERVSQARQRLSEFELEESRQDAIRSRLGAFKELMQQARFELAQAEAQVFIQENLARGIRPGPGAYAAYRISQSAGSLREQRELRRLREDRYLLTMLQVEKSFIPYPDEPPVHFPPATVWRELTGGRVERYSSFGLGPEAPASFRRMRSILEGEVDRRVRIQQNLSALTLDALLAQLTQDFADFGVRFVYRNDLFPPDVKPGETKLRTPNDLSGLPLGAFLDTVLRDVEMSWIARPEYIEIGPNNATYSLRYDEKVTRVFDVADLVIAIPSSVNPQTLQQNLQAFGAQLAIFGNALGLNTPFGGGAGLGAGAFGGNVGGFAAGGFPPPGGMQNQGVPAPFSGNGGVTGVLGNLSGQFGIQGNDQSQYLITLITSVVARGEWDLNMIGGFQQQLFDPDQLGNAQPLVGQSQLNSLGFYPPTWGLVVRGSSRYHQTNSFKLKPGQGAIMQGPPGLPREGQFAGLNPGQVPAAAGANAGGGAAVAAAPAKPDPAKQITQFVAKAGKDPQKVWNEAFDRFLTSPDVAIDAADALFSNNEPAHAAEALKASIRKGRTTSGWAHDALAIALQAGQGSPEEVERAALSAIDLEPADPKAFLKAAKAESELGRHEVALAFCQRAAALEPNLPTPYANALVYADRATEVKSDVVSWATANLLNREWAADGVDYHAQARTRTTKIAAKLSAAGRKDEADKLQASLTGEKVRDLVIELRFQGKADLDLVVEEPTGSTASVLRRRTAGGGVLRPDVLEQKDDDRSEVYTAAAAFPGTYQVSVKKVLGRLNGNRATLVVTKYEGTDRKVSEVHSVDLNDPKPVTITLEKGSRTELASVPEEVSRTRLATTLAPAETGTQRMQGGAAAGAGQFAPATVDGKAVLPVVAPVREQQVKGITPGLPGLRVETKLSADRSKMVMSANPVFTGPAKDLPLPKVNLLPGGN